jgi:hypothetical protein
MSYTIEIDGVRIMELAEGRTLYELPVCNANGVDTGEKRYQWLKNSYCNFPLVEKGAIGILEISERYARKEGLIK